MRGCQVLSRFYEVIVNDSRISATHISLYMALFQKWKLNGFCNPVLFKSAEIMPLAKIDSRATYHKCLNDLAAYKYIDYIASPHSALRSMVYMKLAGM